MPLALEVDNARSGGPLVRLVDRLIPAELHADLDAQLRSRVLVGASFGLGGLTALVLTIHLANVAFERGAVVAGLVTAVMLALPFVQRALRSHRIAGAILVVTLTLGFAFLQINRGVFPDTVVPALTIVPLVAMFFVGPRFGFASAAALTAMTVGLGVLFPAPSPAAFAEFRSTYVAVAAVAPVMCVVLAAAFEQARVRSQAQLAAVNAALVDAQARAEAASRGKTEFLRHTSHELRTPLNAILGYAEMVGEQLRDEAHPAAEDLARIHGAGAQLLALINDLLDLSRVEAGAIALDLGDVDVPALLAAVRDTALPLAAVRHNTLVLDVPAALPPLRTDEQRLRQILLNLASNACKFTERGRVVLSAAVADDRMIFHVRDTGVGMSPAQQARLFEPFVQVHASAERRHQGSGLGLALSRQLAERLGGAIALTSEPDHGTDFIVSLPLRPAE